MFFEVQASVCHLRPGDAVDPETPIGLDWQTGEEIRAGFSGVVRTVAFNADHHSLVVDVDESS